LALVLGACASAETRLEETWERFVHLQEAVTARWESIPLDAAQRQAFAMPDENPVAQIARITMVASHAYLLKDLPALESALDLLVACDAEVAEIAVLAK
jgi:hypothetical protein